MSQLHREMNHNSTTCQVLTAEMFSLKEQLNHAVQLIMFATFMLVLVTTHVAHQSAVIFWACKDYRDKNLEQKVD